MSELVRKEFEVRPEVIHAHDEWSLVYSVREGETGVVWVSRRSVDGRTYLEGFLLTPGNWVMQRVGSEQR